MRCWDWRVRRNEEEVNSPVWPGAEYGLMSACPSGSGMTMSLGARGLSGQVLDFLGRKRAGNPGSRNTAARRVVAERERGGRLICRQGCVSWNRFQSRRR